MNGDVSRSHDLQAICKEIIWGPVVGVVGYWWFAWMAAGGGRSVVEAVGHEGSLPATPPPRPPRDMSPFKASRGEKKSILY